MTSRKKYKKSQDRLRYNNDIARFGKRMKLISRLSIIPSSRDRFRGLVTNTIWLVSCSALDGLIGARLRSTHPGLLRRGAETPTDDQEITEAGQFIFLFNISEKEKFIYIYNKRFVSNQNILLI